jgi:uncharacterized membrane protein YbhN (UPF0104 family)
MSALKVFIRVAVGAGVIAVLVWRGDIDTIGNELARVRPGYIVIAIVLMVGVLVVSAFRWRVFLRELDIELPTGTLLRLYFVGTFFNAFLPTGVGGDAYKAFRLGRGSRSLAHAFASVVLDRFAGIIGLAIIGLVAVAARLASGDRRAVVTLAGLLGAGIIVVTIVLLTQGERLLGRGGSTWFGIRPKLRRLFSAIASAGRRLRAVRWAVLGGLIAQAFVLSAHLSLAAALDLKVPAAVLAAILVIATVAATAPITINGLGVREAAWVWSLGFYGVSGGNAVAFAILVLAVALASSAIGGIVYVVMGAEVSKE